MAASVRKTYFLAADLSLPPDGPLRLGSILSQPTKSLSILNSRDYIPVPDQDVSSTIKTDFRNISESSDFSALSMWAKFLQVQGLAGVDNSRVVNTDFSCRELVTLSFSPKEDYIRKVVDSEPVKEYLRGGVFSKPLYLVTGLKIARGAHQISRSKNMEKSKDAAADIGSVILGAPVGTVSVAGLETLSGSKAGQRMLFGDTSDFIFAYRVRKIMFRKWKQTEEKPRALGWRQADNEAGDSKHPPLQEPSVPAVPEIVERDRMFDAKPVVAKDDETAPDETQPVRILCLDGGGVRGISSLCMLRELMLEVGAEKQRQSEANGGAVKKPECCRPCDYFDLICGTSTGGLIALMLGRMQYTVDDAIKYYSELAREVFTTKSKDPKAKYDYKKLEEKIKYVIEKAPFPTDVEAMMEEPDGQEGCCKVFVVTTSQDNGSMPYLMRTYESNSGQPGPGPFPAKIWEAARATSAAPTFFLPIPIKTKPGLQNYQRSRGNDVEEIAATTMIFGDGGTTANNPSFEALVEYQSIWPWRPLGCLVSLGTGVEEEARIKEDNSWMMRMLRRVTPSTAFLAEVGKYCAKVATSCEKIHDDMNKVMEGLRWEERYFRLNVKYDKKIDLDEYEKVQDMEDESTKYMKQEGPKKTKEKVGVILVDPESERNRQLDKEWGLHGFSVPEFQSTLAIPTSWRESQPIEPESSAVEARGTITNVNEPGSSRNDASSPGISEDDELPGDLTWPLYRNQLSAVQSVIFYHYDNFSSGWDYAKQPRHGESVLFDRRDQGESAVAILELRSKASFVSKSFIDKFNIKPQPVPAVSRKPLKIGLKEFRPASYIALTFRCRGFKMPKQRQCFYVLNSSKFEIMFGEDIINRSQLAKHATRADESGQQPDSKQTVAGSLKAKAQPLIGKGKGENTKWKERDNSEWGPISYEYVKGGVF